MSFHIRQLEHKDIPNITNYWLNSSYQHLISMGVDLEKIPKAELFNTMLELQIELEDHLKQSYALIWEIEGKPIGHSNVNKIIFGNEAYMHLHIWDKQFRKSGFGKALVKRSLKIFFEVLELKRIICEPYALNKAPNRTLEQVGFKLEKTYRTIPGSINFEQEVNRWIITKEDFLNL